MTCKDCVHFELCDALSIRCSVPTVEASDCLLFKNKADFVGVVRCKDCVFYVDGGICFNGVATVGYKKVTLDDFCSYGERKEWKGDK